MSRLAGREVIAELGPDNEAAHEVDRAAVRFDLWAQTAAALPCRRTRESRALNP
jgi:hypothetical protein